MGLLDAVPLQETRGVTSHDCAMNRNWVAGSTMGSGKLR